MNIKARVENGPGSHRLVMASGGEERSVSIAPKPAGRGSSVNGGELLAAALATCVCNDLFREAGKRGIELGEIEVSAEAEFAAEGAAAASVAYSIRLSGAADADVLRELARHTDGVAEIQNTVRAAVPVTLADVEIVAP